MVECVLMEEIFLVYGMYIRVSIFYFFRGFVLGVYGGYFGGSVNVVFFYCVLFY